MARIGSVVDILMQDGARQRFISEGRATIVGRTSWEHTYWVRFVGSDDVVMRRIDPVGALLGSSSTAALNELIDEHDGAWVVVDAPEPAIAVRRGRGADATLIFDPFNFAEGVRMRGKTRSGG